MATIYEGDHHWDGHSRFAVVVSRFNEFITDRLLDGALRELRRWGVSEDRVDIAHCPGAVEVPLVARQMAASGRYGAVICLAAVIRGETPHFDYVCSMAASGIARTACDTGVPAIFGILTTDTVEQAFERAGAGAGNKGAEAALTAIETINLLQKLADLPTSK